jgi:glycosyltransferase involved in cell wall biosynthesis
LRRQRRPIVVLPAGRSRLPAFRRLVRELRPSLVHSMLYEADQVARLGSIGLAVPVLTSLVNTSYSRERMAADEVSAPKLRLVQVVDATTSHLLVRHFHAVSESVKADAVAHLWLRPQSITVVPRGRFDPRPDVGDSAAAEIRAELGIPLTATVVLAVGRHEAQKDLPTLVRAMASLLAANGDLWLLIAGRQGRATGALEAECAAVAERSRIVLLGHRGDVPRVMAAADLLAMTSRYEGMPGAVIEGMAMGLPVVASDIGPVREVVEPGRSALLAPAGDVAGFTRALQSVIDDRDMRIRLGRRGRELFEAKFTIDRSAVLMRDLYGSIAR